MSWVGIDLDGTLAKHGEFDPAKIGAPIPDMVRFVKKLHGHGIEVRIMTARANDITDRNKKNLQAWLLEHLGFIPRITSSKDYEMSALYDDRAVGIVPNEGRRVDGRRLDV